VLGLAIISFTYDGTGLLVIYEKVCDIDGQLLKAEIKTFKTDATVFEHSKSRKNFTIF